MRVHYPSSDQIRLYLPREYHTLEWYICIHTQHPTRSFEPMPLHCPCTSHILGIPCPRHWYCNGYLYIASAIQRSRDLPRSHGNTTSALKNMLWRTYKEWNDYFYQRLVLLYARWISTAFSGLEATLLQKNFSWEFFYPHSHPVLYFWNLGFGRLKQFLVSQRDLFTDF